MIEIITEILGPGATLDAAILVCSVIVIVFFLMLIYGLYLVFANWFK